jgi:hypothetical protein
MPRYLIAVFTAPDELLDATQSARMAGYPIHDAFTPFAVHGLDRAMGMKPSRLTWVCFGAAMCGAAFALWFQWWVSAIDWPLVIGGKPLNSLPAFIPVTFEFAVLSAGITIFLTLWARSRLWPGKRAALPVPGLTDNQFALVLRADTAAFDTDAARRLMLGAGATEVRDVGAIDG